MTRRLPPTSLDVRRDETAGLTLLRLPDGRVQTYTDDELAGMLVEHMHQAVRVPAAVSEEYAATLRHLVGEERWREAVRVIVSLG